MATIKDTHKLPSYTTHKTEAIDVLRNRVYRKKSLVSEDLSWGAKAVDEILESNKAYAEGRDPVEGKLCKDRDVVKVPGGEVDSLTGVAIENLVDFSKKSISDF